MRYMNLHLAYSLMEGKGYKTKNSRLAFNSKLDAFMYIVPSSNNEETRYEIGDFKVRMWHFDSNKSCSVTDITEKIDLKTFLCKKLTENVAKEYLNDYTAYWSNKTDETENGLEK